MPKLVRGDIQDATRNPRDPRATADVSDKRQAILVAARDLFATQGYDETTIAQVARAARVAVGTAYLYFENKRDILVEVCVGLNAEIATVIQSPAILSLPLQQIPRAVIEALFGKGRQNQRFMSCYRVAVESPKEIARLSAGDQGIAVALDAFFQHLVATEQVSPFDTAAYAMLLTSLVGSALQQCFGLENGAREAFYRESVIDLVERLFFGPAIAPDMASGAARPEAQSGVLPDGE
ncbi:MAG TPA: TetR/AcrR family transcriptional regulator [Ktedonobacterales bacterium]